jgi:hypothetical protein
MPLATKDNAIIVKDGKVAEDCKCCDLCVNPPSYLKMTVNGLPDKINSPYRARSIADDNGSEYTMFQITKSQYKLLPTRCAWAGGGHSAYNRVNQTDGFSADLWYLDADNDFVVAYGSRFAPPDGATFRSLPYTDERPLVPVFFGGVDVGTVQDWSNVVITIDEGKASYAQCACPGGFSDYTNCTSADVSGGIKTTACNTTANQSCLSSISDFQARVSFAFEGNAYEKLVSAGGVENLLPDFEIDLSELDSELDLVWLNDSGFIGFNAFRYGIGVDGSQLISQGYRFIGRLPNAAPVSYGRGGGSNNLLQSGSLSFWVAVAIRPTASAWEANATQNLTQRCGQGQVSWNAQVMLFQTAGDDSRFYAGPQSAAAYFTIPCHSYTCGEGPQSFSATKSVPFVVNPLYLASNAIDFNTYFTGSITLESA